LSDAADYLLGTTVNVPSGNCPVLCLLSPGYYLMDTV